METCVISYHWWLQWLLVLYHMMGGYSGDLCYIILFVVTVETSVLLCYGWLQVVTYVILHNRWLQWVTVLCYITGGYLCYTILWVITAVTCVILLYAQLLVFTK